MSEHKRNSERLYEWLDPEARFVVMADAIIKGQGRAIPFNNPYAPPKKVAIWQDAASISHRLAYTDKGDSAGQDYLLETLRPDGSSLVRYYLKKYRGELMPLEKVDTNWRPIVMGEDRRIEEIKYALDILTRKAGKEADRALGIALEKRFPEVAAVYTLSDLAVETDEPGRFIDELVVPEQKDAFTEKMNEFENLMVILCTNYDGTVDHELHTDLRRGAEPDAHNSYANFDLRSTMVAVAKSIGASWQNIITPDHHDFIK